MKLWILRPVDNTKEPWTPWYDKCFGFVIQADNESEARELAHHNAGDESRGSIDPWLDSNYSTCVELIASGESKVIMEDFHSA